MPRNPINGTSNNDSIRGTEESDLIHGLEGDDSILGLNGSDHIFGDEGDDYLTGGGGHDLIRGGEGNDDLFGGGDNDILHGGDGDDVLNGGRYYGGGDGEDWLYGGAGNDIIFSDYYAAQNYDHAFGGGGDDTIKTVFSHYRPLGGEMHGGSGFDTLEIISSDSRFVTPPDFDYQLAISGPDEGGSYRGGTLEISGIEALNIQTGIGDDDITGGAYSDLIDVRQGANTVDGRGGDDHIIYTYGEANTIDGGGGNDTLELQFLTYGTVVGPLVLDAGGAVVTESFGSSITGIENYIIRGTAAADNVTFGAGTDVFHGGEGNDYADGGAGDDELYGGEGRDHLIGGDGNDRISGASENRFGLDGKDIIYGGAGNDVIEGGRGSDKIFGGDGNDFIYGGFKSIGFGNDVLDGELIRGGSGNDYIREEITSGRPQNARIFGDSGNDRIVLNGGGESFVHGGSGIDVLEIRDVGLSYQDHDDIVFNINRAGLPTEIVSAGYTLKSMERLDITTGNGNDTIGGGDRADIIRVTGGDNIVNAYGGQDVISIHTGWDTRYGSTNTVDGGSGFDILQVNHFGLDGLDFVVTGATATDAYGAAISGIERYELTGGDFDDVAILGDGRDRFFGSAGNDTAFGGDGKDALIGGFGEDILNGEGGRDAIVGGRDFDTLSGGADADKFRFGFLDGIADDILDYETGLDLFQFRAERLGLTDPGDPTVITSDYFALGAATAAHGQFVFTTNGVDGALHWDANGAAEGGLINIANLQGVTDLDYSDIYLT